MTQTQKLRSHYQALFERHGATPHAVQWSSTESQVNRFRVLADTIEPGESVADLGCGLGDLLGYLRKTRGFLGQYVGLDLVPEFVDYAQRAYASDPRAAFQSSDVENDPLPRANVYVGSGLFNNRTEGNWDYLTGIVARMFEHAERAVVFNALSTYVDYQDEHLYYCDPLRLFDHVKRTLTKHVILRHDYLVKENSIPFEFTMVLLR